MATRRIDRELRLTTALNCLQSYRSRAHRAPETVIERQRKDRRRKRPLPTDASVVFSIVDAISAGQGLAAAMSAAGSGAGGSGIVYPGGGGEWNEP